MKINFDQVIGECEIYLFNFLKLCCGSVFCWNVSAVGTCSIDSKWNWTNEFLVHKFAVSQTWEKRLFLYSWHQANSTRLNRYRRKRPKVDASIFDSALSHTRRSDASKKEKKIACPLLDVFACGQLSSPRLYRLSLWKFITGGDFYSKFKSPSLIVVLRNFHLRMITSQFLSTATCRANHEGMIKFYTKTTVRYQINYRCQDKYRFRIKFRYQVPCRLLISPINISEVFVQ